MTNRAARFALTFLASASLASHGCAAGSDDLPRTGIDGTDSGTPVVDGSTPIPDGTLPDGDAGNPGPWTPTEPSISASLVSEGLWEITIDQGTFQLTDGQEGTYCVRLPMPEMLRDKELVMVGADYDLPIGTHHYFMAYSRNTRDAIEPCVPDEGALLPLEGEAMEMEDPGQYLAGFPRGVGSGDMREGFGLYMSPNGHFVTNHHVLNITGQQLNMHGRFKFRVKERSAVPRIMRPLNCLNQAIRVEPGQTVDVTATCVATYPIEIVQLGSHAHQHLDKIEVRVFRGGTVNTDLYPESYGPVAGKDGNEEYLDRTLIQLAYRYPLAEFFNMKIAEIVAAQRLDFSYADPNSDFWERYKPVHGGSVQPEVIYTSTEWDAPAGIDRTGNPIALAAGDGLTYTCRYTNPKSVPVLYGVHEDEEMCATMNLYVLPDAPENRSVVPPSLANVVNWEPGFIDTPQPNTVNVLVSSDEIRKVYPGDFAF